MFKRVLKIKLVFLLSLLIFSTHLQAQSLVTSQLEVDGQEARFFTSVEQWDQGLNNRVTFYTKDSRFEFMSDSGFKVGHTSTFELDFWGELRQVCSGDVLVTSVSWRDKDKTVLDSLGLEFSGECSPNWSVPVSGKVLFNVPEEDNKDYKLLINQAEITGFQYVEKEYQLDKLKTTIHYDQYTVEFIATPNSNPKNAIPFELTHFVNSSLGYRFIASCSGHALAETIKWNSSDDRPDIEEIKLVLDDYSCKGWIRPSVSLSITAKNTCTANQDLIDENNTLKDTIDFLNDDLLSANDQISGLNSTVDSLNQNLVTANGKISGLNNTVNSLNKDLAAANGQIAGLEKVVKASEAKYGTCQAIKDELIASSIDSSTQIELKDQKIKLLEGERDFSVAKASRLKRKVKRLQQKLKRKL